MGSLYAALQEEPLRCDHHALKTFTLVQYAPLNIFLYEHLACNLKNSLV